MPKDVQLEVADGIEGPWRVVKAFTVEATVPTRQVRYMVPRSLPLRPSPDRP